MTKCSSQAYGNARVQEIMSHPTPTLKDLGEKVSQGLSISRYKDEAGQPVFIVNVKDLENLYINHVPEKITISGLSKINHYRLLKNDVVIAIRGTLLKSSVVTAESEGSIAGPNVAVFRPKNLEILNPAYIAVLLCSEWSQKFLKNYSSTTLPSIRVSELREIEIPLPEKNIQNKFVELFLLYESYTELSKNALNARRQLIESSLLKTLNE